MGGVDGQRQPPGEPDLGPVEAGAVSGQDCRDSVHIARAEVRDAAAELSPS